MMLDNEKLIPIKTYAAIDPNIPTIIALTNATMFVDTLLNAFFSASVSNEAAKEPIVNRNKNS